MENYFDLMSEHTGYHDFHFNFFMPFHSEQIFLWVKYVKIDNFINLYLMCLVTNDYQNFQLKKLVIRILAKSWALGAELQAELEGEILSDSLK